MAANQNGAESPEQRLQRREAQLQRRLGQLAEQAMEAQDAIAQARGRLASLDLEAERLAEALARILIRRDLDAVDIEAEALVQAELVQAELDRALEAEQGDDPRPPQELLDAIRRELGR